MLFSRLDDEWYLVKPEIFRSKKDYVFVTVSKILKIKILKTKNVSVSNRFGTGTFFFEWKKNNISLKKHKVVDAYDVRNMHVIPPGGARTPYDGLYGKALPERGIFFKLHEYERVGILIVEVYKKVGKSVIWVCERLQKV